MERERAWILMILLLAACALMVISSVKAQRTINHQRHQIEQLKHDRCPLV